MKLDIKGPFAFFLALAFLALSSAIYYFAEFTEETLDADADPKSEDKKQTDE